MSDRPLAYHITFGTYGTRLHGDARGTVDRGMNQPGDPIIGADPLWWELERGKLRFDPVVLRPEQMVHVESVMPEICARGGWTYHVGAGGPDHVHALLTADAEGDAVRTWFKRWLGESMSSRWPRAEGIDVVGRGREREVGLGAGLLREPLRLPEPSAREWKNLRSYAKAAPPTKRTQNSVRRARQGAGSCRPDRCEAPTHAPGLPHCVWDANPRLQGPRRRASARS